MPTEVRLMVYDLFAANEWIGKVGLGGYHCAISVYGIEYSYGGTDCPEDDQTGVYEIPEGSADLDLREFIVLGEVELNRRQVDRIVDSMRPQFLAADYHILRQNCIHFCEALALRLGMEGIPRWTNRLATIGAFFDFLLPERFLTFERVPTVADCPLAAIEGAKLSSASNNEQQTVKQIVLPTGSAVSPATCRALMISSF
eukprot:TRINITY_DN5232_c0_g1_i1.p2 TRINITY_DN5232_c0_g1~~TRINITY_DN5232_c0_g1_i1.p2  ORF type:complete len:200 (+),score=37.61 TRINITY_DN5232_c0_g1_i1:166-765(+)